jgi:hypothetical protein
VCAGISGMKFYPKETFELKTPLSISEILVVLDSEVIPTMRFQWRAGGRKFIGRYSSAGFTLRQFSMGNYGNRPVVEGTFHACESGTLIRMTMRLHGFTMIFMSFWFSFAIIGMLSVLIKEIKNGTQSISLFIVSFGFILLPMILMSRSFWCEVRKNKRLLIDMFCKKIPCEPSGQPD